MEILPRAELEVMQALWNATPPLTSRIVMDEVGYKHGWKNSTVSTFLSRLANKGFLAATRKGREIHYDVTVSSEQYMQVETEAFIKKYQGRSLQNLVAAFAQNDELDAQQIDELSTWLEQQKKKLS